jgi:hypothetical protein
MKSRKFRPPENRPALILEMAPDNNFPKSSKNTFQDNPAGWRNPLHYYHHIFSADCL